MQNGMIRDLHTYLQRPFPRPEFTNETSFFLITVEDVPEALDRGQCIARFIRRYSPATIQVSEFTTESYPVPVPLAVAMSGPGCGRQPSKGRGIVFSYLACLPILLQDIREEPIQHTWRGDNLLLAHTLQIWNRYVVLPLA